MALNPEYFKIGEDIIGAAFTIRKLSGHCLREIYYEKALVYELKEIGYNIKEQVVIPALYKGHIIDDSYLADILVDDKVIIEVKALSIMTEKESRQLLTYLRLSNCKLGYLINFGAKNFQIGKTFEELPYRHGIYRFVNNI